MASEDRSFFSNKRLFRWHGWLGLNLGLLLFVVCFSGTIAVFSYEIDWLIDPAMRGAVAEDGVHWTAIADSVEANDPNHAVSFIRGPRHPGFAATAYAEDPTGRNVKFYVDPVSGTVNGRNNFWNVQRFFRSFHRRMFAPNPYGILWVTFFAGVLLASALTGILFYKGWYRHLFRWRWDDVRLLFSDGHRLAGVWSLAFTAIMVATGVWYMAERFAPTPGPDPPEITEEALVERGETPELLPLGEQVQRAREAFPALEVKDVVPGTAARATQVRGQAAAWLVRPRANTVRVDPVTGEVLSVQRATEASVYHRIADMADPLHFGTFGGLWSQAAWFLFGLLLSSLMLTGGWLWHQRAEQKARTAGAGRHPRWNSVAAALPVVVLVVSAVYGYGEVEGYMRPDAPRRVEVHTQDVGPWTARLMRMPASDAGTTEYRVEFDGPGRRTANLNTATLRWTGAPDSTAASRHPNVPVTTLLSTAPPPTADSTLTIAATTWDGTTYRDTVSTTVFASASLTTTTAAMPIPPVPVAVWGVIGLFVAVLLGVVVTWLVAAQRTARRRAQDEDAASDDAARSIPVTADLPTSEST